MTQKPIVATLIVLYLASAPYAASAQKGLYLGVGAGPSSFDTDVHVSLNVNGAPAPVTHADLDDVDLGFNALVGYRFVRHFAVEAAYIDVGGWRYTASLQPASSSIPISLGISTSMRGLSTSALGILPLSGRWELFGRAGLLFADTDERFTLFHPDFGIDIDESDSGRSTLTLLGAGATFNANERWNLRLEYQRLPHVNDAGADIDSISVGVLRRLRGR